MTGCVIVLSHSSAFGDLLKGYRGRAGLTQEELAERAQLSIRGISDLERGINRTPRRDTVAALANALGLSPAEREAFLAVARAGRQSAPPAHAPTGIAARRHTPLVGRLPEMALLERMFNGEAPQVLALAGEPGIGKSRLLREAAALGAARGMRVLHGGCQSRAGQGPYAPLLEALERDISRLTPAQRRAALQGCEHVASLLPELVASAPTASRTWTLSPDQERRLMFAAVGRFLANTAGPEGVLLVLDDLQWARADALDLLATLVRREDGPPVHVAAAYRDTEVRTKDALPQWLAALSREGLARRLWLGPLPEEDAAQLVKILLADERGGQSVALDEDHIHRVVERAGGIPLYLVSSVQALRANGRCDMSGEPLAVSDEPVPWDVAEMLSQRIAELPATAREALKVAAMIGRRAPLWLLKGVIEQPEEQLAEALELACADRLLLDGGDAEYEFAHDVIREVVASEVGSARRALLHRRIAETLEREPGGPHVERLAYHYARSGDIERAAHYLELAGDRALALGALAEAESAYREAVERLERLGRSAPAAGVREKLGRILMTRAHFAEAHTVFEAALSAYDAACDADGAGRAVAQIAWGHARQGQPTAGLKRIAEFFAHPRAQTVQPHTRMALLMARAFLHFMRGEYREQLAVDEAILTLAQEIGEAAMIAQVAAHRSLSLTMLGRHDEALLTITEVLPCLEGLGDPQSLLMAYNALSSAHTVHGKLDLALEYMWRQLSISEQLGDLVALVFELAALASIHYFRGDWDEAQAVLDRAEQLATETGPCWGTPYVLEGRGRILLARGQTVEGMQSLSRALEQAQSAHDVQAICGAQSALAEADLLGGRAQRALERIGPLAADDEAGANDSMGVLYLLAWCHLELGDVTQAAEVARRSLSLARERHDNLALLNALIICTDALAACEDQQAARDTSTEAVELARRIRVPYGEAQALYRAGRLASQQGRMEAARQQLTAALAILRRLDEHPYAERVERVLAIVT